MREPNSQETTTKAASTSEPPSQSPRLLDRLRDACRVRHYGLRTEKTYAHWVCRYVRHHNHRHPMEMGAAEINAFLTHLARDLNVSASTQNQALCALVFLYRHVLNKDPGNFKDVIRAKRPQIVPVILSAREVQRILEKLTGTYHLMVMLLYGGGLRIMELVRLRLKDVDEALMQKLAPLAASMPSPSDSQDLCPAPMGAAEPGRPTA